MALADRGSADRGAPAGVVRVRSTGARLARDHAADRVGLLDLVGDEAPRHGEVAVVTEGGAPGVGDLHALVVVADDGHLAAAERLPGQLVGGRVVAVVAGVGGS